MLQRYFFFFLLLISASLYADEIKIGSSAPEIVLKNKADEPVSLQNLNKNKYVLIHFWAPSALQSRTNHAAINQLAVSYKSTALNGAEGFEVLAVGLDKLKESWEMAILKDQFTAVVNVFDANGLFSQVAKKYNVNSLPADYLIDQNGKIIAINPSPAELEKTLKKLSGMKASNQLQDILAKLLYGEKKKMPLAHQKIFLLSSKGDTLKSAETDDYGDFAFLQVNVSQEMNLVVGNTGNVKTNALFLAKQNGEIVNKFTKTASGFEFKLLPKEIHKLTEIAEEDPGMKLDAFAKSAEKVITVTENIYYPSKEFKVLDEAGKKLNAIADVMKKNDQLKLEIYSHTDSKGEDAFNLDLSRKRANAALEYLVSKGIDKKRLKATGLGETKLLNRCTNGENCSEKEHELNRRTEFKFSK